MIPLTKSCHQYQHCWKINLLALWAGHFQNECSLWSRDCKSKVSQAAGAWSPPHPGWHSTLHSAQWPWADFAPSNIASNIASNIVTTVTAVTSINSITITKNQLKSYRYVKVCDFQKSRRNLRNVTNSVRRDRIPSSLETRVVLFLLEEQSPAVPLISACRNIGGVVLKF